MAPTSRYEVQYTPAAFRDLEGMPRQVQTRLIARIETLAADPRPQA